MRQGEFHVRARQPEGALDHPGGQRRYRRNRSVCAARRHDESSLIYKAAQKPEYRALIEDAVRHASAHTDSATRPRAFLDELYVNFGCELLKIVPGRVSTETDARFSFDSASIVDQAERLIALYERAGIERARVLIKVASTWEGIRAAQLLEQRSIHCNLTLMFSFSQAVACAEARVTLVSPEEYAGFAATGASPVMRDGGNRL